MIYAERVPRLRAAGEFSLSAPHPAVSPGWRSVPLPVSFSFPPSFRGPFPHRREDSDASFSDDVQLPAASFLFFRSFAERFRGRRANHRATTSGLSYVRLERTACGLEVDTRRNLSETEVREADTSKSEFL